MKRKTLIDDKVVDDDTPDVEFHFNGFQEIRVTHEIRENPGRVLTYSQ